jgi:hypothetical protein
MRGYPTDMDKADERFTIEADPDEALRALLKADAPEAEPHEDDPTPPHGDPLRPRRRKNADK